MIDVREAIKKKFNDFNKKGFLIEKADSQMDMSCIV